MATFAHDGEDFDLVTDIDDLEVGDAEIIETDLGLDLREITSAPLSKQLQAYLLISLRRKRPGASLADVRRVKLGPLLAAFNAKAKDEGGAVDQADPVVEPAEVEVLSPTSAGSCSLPA